MTNLDLLKTLTSNVCVSKNVDPDDIDACLSLARRMNGFENETDEEFVTLKWDAPIVNKETMTAHGGKKALLVWSDDDNEYTVICGTRLLNPFQCKVKKNSVMFALMTAGDATDYYSEVVIDEVFSQYSKNRATGANGETIVQQYTIKQSCEIVCIHDHAINANGENNGSSFQWGIDIRSLEEH